MTKNDKKVILAGIALSIFVGVVVLGVVMVKNRKKVKIRKLRELVKEDLKFWDGINEISPDGAKKLSDWWKNLGYTYTPEQLMSPSFQGSHYWSAVYISNLMKRWGAGDRFKYSASHSSYIVDGKEAKTSKNNRLYKTYPADQVKIEVGDIVALSRSTSVNYDNLYVGAPTHTDVVFDIKKTPDGYIAYVIGGNISNTVKSSTVSLDKNKKIINADQFLAVMKNQDV